MGVTQVRRRGVPPPPYRPPAKVKETPSARGDPQGYGCYDYDSMSSDTDDNDAGNDDDGKIQSSVMDTVVDGGTLPLTTVTLPTGSEDPATEKALKGYGCYEYDDISSDGTDNDDGNIQAQKQSSTCSGINVPVGGGANDAGDAGNDEDGRTDINVPIVVGGGGAPPATFPTSERDNGSATEETLPGSSDDDAKETLDGDEDLSGYDAAYDLNEMVSNDDDGKGGGEEDQHKQEKNARLPFPPSPPLSIADRIARRGLIRTTRHNRTNNFTEGTRLARVKNDPAAQARGFTITTQTSAEFLNRIKSIGEVVIRDHFKPLEDRVFRPKDVGGKAGGTKYIEDGLFFKFADPLEGYEERERGMREEGGMRR